LANGAGAEYGHLVVGIDGSVLDGVVGSWEDIR
jgi:hypothetical protein